jgi:hypothetical protein
MAPQHQRKTEETRGELILTTAVEADYLSVSIPISYDR